MTTKPPEVDDLDAAYAEIAEKPYQFSYRGKQWTLPHMAELDYRTREKVENFEIGGDVDMVTAFLALLFGAQAGEWAELEQTDKFLLMMFQRWMAHSGVGAGEDKASSSSSGSTGKSLRRTSGATTTSASPKPSTAKRAPRKAASPRGNSSA